MQGIFDFIFEDFVFIQVAGRCMMEYLLENKNSYVISVVRDVDRVFVKKEFALVKNLKKNHVEVILTSPGEPQCSFIFDSCVLDKELGVNPCPSVKRNWTLVFE